jgi:hypothetical protein
MALHHLTTDDAARKENKFPSSLSDLHTLAASAEGKLQHVLADFAVHRARFGSLFNVSTSPSHHARLLSQAQDGAAAFLLALPGVEGLALEDAAMRNAVLDWIGHPSAKGEDPKLLAQTCKCQGSKKLRTTPTDKMADDASIGSTEAANHLANCKLGGGVINRHNTIVNEIAEMGRVVGCTPYIEPRGTLEECGNGAPDIIFHGVPRLGKDIFVEIGVVNEAGEGAANRAARQPLSAAIQREKQKRNKYLAASVANRMQLLPAILEVHGAFGPAMATLLDQASKLHARQLAAGRLEEGPPRPWACKSFTQYWTQRIAVALRRGIALMYDDLLRVQRGTRQQLQAERHNRNTAQSKHNNKGSRRAQETARTVSNVLDARARL